MPKNTNLPSAESDTQSTSNPNSQDSRRDITSQTEGYISTNMVHMRAPNRADTKITRSQAIDLMNKMRKLQDEGATLKDGSPIRNKSDVVRWMIEQPLAPIR